MSLKDTTVYSLAEALKTMSTLVDEMTGKMHRLTEEAGKAKANYDTLIKTSIADKAEVQRLKRELADLRSKEDQEAFKEALKRVEGKPVLKPQISIFNNTPFNEPNMARHLAQAALGG